MKFFARPDVLAIAAFLLAPPVTAEIEWRESYYNPTPAEGDLVLPMPCGGAMVFRPVETPSSGGSVGDVRVTLGDESEESPYLNGLRRSYVSGAFPAEEGSAKGVFWIGKYEIAEAQWDVVMSDTCPERTPRRRAFVPAVDHSALDFATFAERYTIWLMEEARDALPAAEETLAYLRLPTEDEWEYAARGGLAVGDAAFRAPLPPFGEGREPGEFIAHGGTDSAGGRVQVIGTLAPNPLGLHDMLGNAGEIVSTPFSLVRHGRLHGQAGGIIKRGGDARTPLAGITSATRFEVPPFDVNGPGPSKDRFTGARLAMAGLAITSAEATERMIVDLQRLAEIDPGLSTASSEAEIDAILLALEGQIDTPQGAQQIAVIKRTIDAARAERNAQRNRSIRLLQESGTLMCDQVVQRLLNALAIDSLRSQFDDFEDEARAAGDLDALAEIEAARAETDADIARLESQMRRELEEYADLIEGLGDDYSYDLLARQIVFITPDVQARGPRRAACLDRMGAHLETRATRGFIDIVELEQDMRSIALDRASDR